MIVYMMCKKEEEEERILAIFLYEQRNKKECKGRTLMMTPRREINRHEKRRERANVNVRRIDTCIHQAKLLA